MKKHFYLFAAMLMALMGLSLTACGDDNDEPNNGGDIVGTWEGDFFHLFEATDYNAGIYESSKGYTRFYDDNTYISVSDVVYTDDWVEIYGGDKHEIEIDRGTYKISGNTITGKSLTDPEMISVPMTFSIKGNKMTLVALGLSFTFTRVSDSLINKYLN